jgi:two-component system response regulator GlrR
MTARPRRILIIDTDSDVLEMLRDIATDLGYEVHTIQDWALAPAIVPVFRPDVIRLDLAMPTMSRDSALEIVHRDHPHVPVIIMAPDLTTTESVSAGGAGAVGFVRKPVDRRVVELALALVIGDRPGLEW